MTMIALVHQASQSPAQPALATWREGLRAAYADADIDAFTATLAFVEQHAADTRTADGEPLAGRALGAATILASLKLDPATIHAALLLPLAQARVVDAAALAAPFGADVAGLVAGVARMDDIRATPADVAAAEREAQAENLRKMLLAIAEDVRVVLIKLAERVAVPALAHERRRGGAARRRPRRRSSSSRRSPTASASRR